MCDGIHIHTTFPKYHFWTFRQKFPIFFFWESDDRNEAVESESMTGLGEAVLMRPRPCNIIDNGNDYSKISMWEQRVEFRKYEYAFILYYASM